MHEPTFYRKDNSMNDDLTFVLVHGSWHDGACWSSVASHLHDAGIPTLSPTLAGHHGHDDRLTITHDDYVSSVLHDVDSIAGPLALIGHSFGGSVISRVAELRPQRCKLLVYYSAFVPRDGERVADSLPEAFITFLEEAAAENRDGSVVLPKELFRAAFANTADEHTVDVIYPKLVPEPYAPIFESLALPRLERLGIPSAYISCRQDVALPAGSFHPGQSGRLTAPQLIEIDGDHEALFTSPRQLAWALLQAAGHGSESEGLATTGPRTPDRRERSSIQISAPR
jgi:pimeloyl-ACP methyl ester carboxylesterase